MTAPADDAAIREQAYYLWEQDGRPEGRETEHWMRASVALSEKRQLDTLIEPAPEKPKAKGAASKSKAAPATAEAVKKPKKK